MNQNLKRNKIKQKKIYKLFRSLNFNVIKIQNRQKKNAFKIVNFKY